MVPTYESTAREQEIIIKNQRKQIQELTNNWNELEEWVKKHYVGTLGNKFLDKMKEIKEIRNG